MFFAGMNEPFLFTTFICEFFFLLHLFCSLELAVGDSSGIYSMEIPQGCFRFVSAVIFFLWSSRLS